MKSSYIGKLSAVVDCIFNEFVAEMSGSQLSKLNPEQIDRITDRMQAETTAYIGLKGKMYKD